MSVVPSLPAEPARVFKAKQAFIRWPAVFAVLCLIIMAIGVDHKQVQYIPLFGMMTAAFLAIFLSALSLRITMNEEGLKHKWIWGWRVVAWHEVAAVEKLHRRFFGDGLFLLNEQNQEIFAVSVLPLSDQQAIIEEAIKRARLRKDRKALKKGVTERWVRR